VDDDQRTAQYNHAANHQQKPDPFHALPHRMKVYRNDMGTRGQNVTTVSSYGLLRCFFSNPPKILSRTSGN
jgi:DNA-binding response OmpR family regulator